MAAISNSSMLALQAWAKSQSVDDLAHDDLLDGRRSNWGRTTDARPWCKVAQRNSPAVVLTWWSRPVGRDALRKAVSAFFKSLPDARRNDVRHLFVDNPR